MILVIVKYVLTWSIVKFVLHSKATDATPVVTLTPSPVYINIGGSFTLTCQVNQDVGVATVYFKIGSTIKVWVNDITNCGYIKADPNEYDNPSFNYSVTCSGQRSFTMIKYGITSSDHRQTWYCQMVSARDAGPCFGGNNPCISPGVTAIIRIPVTMVQLTDINGQPLSLNITVQSGIVMQLWCDTSPNGSRPGSTFRWYKKQGSQSAILIEDQTISSTPNPVQVPNQPETDLMIYYSTLSLQGRKSYQGANIYCTAQDLTAIGMEVQSREVQLIIAYAPEVNIIPINLVYNVTVGMRNIVLTCQVIDANPPPETNAFSWMHKGATIPGKTSQSYMIQTVETSDDGQYQCSAFNSYGSGSSRIIDLDVQYGPVISPIGTIEIKEGGTLSVTCNHSANPVSNVLWTRSGQEISNLSVMEIPSISRNLDGDFICTASNVLYPTGQDSVTKTASYTLKVIVLYGPGNSIKIDRNVSMYEVEEGKTAEGIVCSAICKPSCSYKWLRNNAIISSHDTLSLGVVQRNTTGSYVCEAYNTVQGVINSSTVSVEVTVKYGAKINYFLVQRGTTVNENESVTFQCSIDSYPKSTITMKRESDGTILKTEMGVLQSQYWLPSAHCLDTDNYTCSASNNISQPAVRTIQFFVKCHPRLDFRVPFVNVTYGKHLGDAILRYTVISYPPPRFTWTFLGNGSESRGLPNSAIQSDYGQQSELRFTKLDIGDFGSYRVIADNTINEPATAVFWLLLGGTPGKPLNFHASSVQEKQLSLTWQSGYHGGFTQTFVVEISLDNITWINVSEVSAGNRDGWFSTVIEDLIPGSEYYLRLYAYNINGRGDFADVQLAIRMFKESSCPSALEVDASAGIGVGGALGIGVGGVVLGLIAATIAFTIRRQLNGPTNSCFRSKGKTDEEMHPYSNTVMNPKNMKPIYEELNKENTERSVYDKILPL